MIHVVKIFQMIKTCKPEAMKIPSNSAGRCCELWMNAHSSRPFLGQNRFHICSCTHSTLSKDGEHMTPSHPQQCPIHTLALLCHMGVGCFGVTVTAPESLLQTKCWRELSPLCHPRPLEGCRLRTLPTCPTTSPQRRAG